MNQKNIVIKTYGEIYKEEYCDHIAMRKYL